MLFGEELTVRFEGSVRIARSACDVFAMLSDVQDWATHPGSPVVLMEKSPPGPTEVGTRWREVVSLRCGRTMTMWSEVTAIAPERELALRFWGGHMHGELVYTIHSERAYTVLRQYETLETTGPLRPFGWLIGRILERRLSRRLLDIRDRLEGQVEG